MRTAVFYKNNADTTRQALMFHEELSRRCPDRKIQLIDVDTRDGASEAALYDVMRLPSVAVIADDGRVLNVWHGGPLPLQDEVMSYMLS